MSDRTLNQLRSDQLADICLIDNLTAKLRASKATMRERHEARMNGGVGNAANDIEVLCGEIAKAAGRIHLIAEEIRVREYEAAQRQAEHDYSPALRLMVQTIASASPANQDSQERART